MAHPIGYHTSYNPQALTPGILDRIQQEWGSQLEHMTYEQKIVMRAALSGYIAEKPVWKTEGSGITCIDACIESAGVDWDIWDKDEFLVEVIQQCSLLSEGDIEGLIAALTEQIRDRVYASRIEEWVVVTP
ncbi:MAG: hypothetical protein LDL41_05765 [Coleofasciculus sp. S288]|nr:hypothetical protein [Coleofasciculus sp. S288]